MKKFIISVLLCLLVGSAASAQSLKVSAVDASNDKLYEKVSKALGKTLTLTFYDNSVSITVPGQSGTLNLKLSSDGHYEKREKTDARSLYYGLTVTKTLGMITSVKLSFSSMKTYSNLTEMWSSITAKRF